MAMSPFVRTALTIGAVTLSLAACSYYKTYETPTAATNPNTVVVHQRAPDTVVVPQSSPSTVVVPAKPNTVIVPNSSAPDTIIVDPRGD